MSVEPMAVAEDRIEISEEQRRRRRARSVAIGFVLAGVVLLFYVLTFVKLGPGAVTRPL